MGGDGRYAPFPVVAYTLDTVREFLPRTLPAFRHAISGQSKTIYALASTHGATADGRRPRAPRFRLSACLFVHSDLLSPLSARPHLPSLASSSHCAPDFTAGEIALPNCFSILSRNSGILPIVPRLRPDLPSSFHPLYD